MTTVDGLGPNVIDISTWRRGAGSTSRRGSDEHAAGLSDLLHSMRCLELVVTLHRQAGQPMANQKEIDAYLNQTMGQLTDHAEKLGIIVKKKG